jgi:hypothetical protein
MAARQFFTEELRRRCQRPSETPSRKKIAELQTMIRAGSRCA